MPASRKQDIGSAPAGRTEGEARSPAGSGVGTGAAEPDPEGLRALAEEISRENPPQLEHTALVLYDRDPEYLQAQWYVTPEELAQARSMFPGDGLGLRQVLRLRRLNGDGGAEVVASIPRESGESKGEGEEGFTLHGEGSEYECELGLESDDGGWLLLARSNRIALAEPDLPASRSASGNGDSHVQDLPHEQVASPNLLEDTVAGGLPAATGESLYSASPNLEPDHSPASGAAWAPEPVPQNDAEKPPAPDGHAEVGTALGAHLADMPPPLLPSSPDRHAPVADMAEARYDPRAALSSAALGSRGTQGSGMEIQAELIVQGRARPDSTVDLYGHPVAVGADGRFYLRRTIDDPTLLSLALGRRPYPIQGDQDPE